MPPLDIHTGPLQGVNGQLHQTVSNESKILQEFDYALVLLPLLYSTILLYMYYICMQMGNLLKSALFQMLFDCQIVLQKRCGHMGLL